MGGREEGEGEGATGREGGGSVRVVATGWWGGGLVYK